MNIAQVILVVFVLYSNGHVMQLPARGFDSVQECQSEMDRIVALRLVERSVLPFEEMHGEIQKFKHICMSFGEEGHVLEEHDPRPVPKKPSTVEDDMISA